MQNKQTFTIRFESYIASVYIFAEHIHLAIFTLRFKSYIASVYIFVEHIYLAIFIRAKQSGSFCKNIYCFSGYFCGTYLPCNIYIFTQNEAVHFARIYCKINLFHKHLHFIFNHILVQCVFLQNIFTLQYLHFVLNHILP